MGACQLGLLSLLPRTLSPLGCDPETGPVPLPAMPLRHSLRSGPGALAPGEAAPRGPRVWLRRRGMHCQGGWVFVGYSVPRCCPLLMPMGHQMFLPGGHAVPRTVSESPPGAQTRDGKSCFGTMWSGGARPLPPLCSQLLSSGLATPPYSRAPPSHPSVLGAGLRLFPVARGGEGPPRPPASQAGLGSGATRCHPEGCRSQSMSQVSPPEAVRLSAPWNEAEAALEFPRPQLFTAEVSPQTSPTRPTADRAALLSAGQAGGGQQAQPRSGGVGGRALTLGACYY